MNPVQRPLENVFKHPPIIMDLAVRGGQLYNNSRFSGASYPQPYAHNGHVVLRWASDSANPVNDTCMVRLVVRRPHRRPGKTIGCYPRYSMSHWHGSCSCRVVDKDGKFGAYESSKVPVIDAL